MTKSNPTPAYIAAHNHLIITRMAPGGRSTIEYRVLPHLLKHASELMAAKLTANATPSERKAFLIELDQTDEGAKLFRPIDLTPPDVRRMTAAQRLQKANEDAVAAEKARKTPIKTEDEK